MISRAAPARNQPRTLSIPPLFLYLTGSEERISTILQPPFSQFRVGIRALRIRWLGVLIQREQEAVVVEIGGVPLNL